MADWVELWSHSDQYLNLSSGTQQIKDSPSLNMLIIQMDESSQGSFKDPMIIYLK